jgi:hypothetical protein
MQKQMYSGNCATRTKQLATCVPAISTVTAAAAIRWETTAGICALSFFVALSRQYITISACRWTKSGVLLSRLLELR